MALIKHKSESVSQLHEDGLKSDLRIVRTRQRIDAAFVELLHRRSYGSIRVGDITRKAGVGRATFYGHYFSKDDLLDSQFRRIVAPMLAIRQHARCPLDATGFFAHVQGAPRIYGALMGPQGGSAPRILRECIERRVRESLADLTSTNKATKPATTTQEAIFHETVLPRFVASALLTVVECWLESGASETPQRLQEIFSKLVGEGLPAGNLGLDQAT